MSERPTLYVTNFANRRMFGPGRRITIMARPGQHFRGDGRCLALAPMQAREQELMAALVAARKRGEADPRTLAYYRALLEQRWRNHAALGEFSPGQLGAQLWGGEGSVAIADGDSLLCSCKLAYAAAGECHRVWATSFLVRAGWRVMLDGVEVTT